MDKYTVYLNWETQSINCGVYILFLVNENSYPYFNNSRFDINS